MWRPQLLRGATQRAAASRSSGSALRSALCTPNAASKAIAVSQRTRCITTLAAAPSFHRSARHFSSSSASSASAESAAAASSNPLLSPNADLGQLPLYSQIDADKVREGCTAMFQQIGEAFTKWEQEAAQQLQQPAGALAWSALIPPLESLSDRLQFVWGTVGHLAAVRDAPALREAVAQMEGPYTELSLRLGQSQVLAKVVRALQQKGDLTPTQNKIADDMLLQARLAGVELSDSDRQKFNALTQRLSAASTAFGHRVLDATKNFGVTIVDKEVMRGIPSAVLQLYAQHAATSEPKIPGATAAEGPWRVGLSHAHLVPFLTYCASRNHRALVAKASAGKASFLDGFDNSPAVAEILSLKHSIAGMLGFDSYAQQSLASKMVPRVEDVEKFLHDLRAVAYPRAQQELKQLQQFAWEQGFPRNQTLQSYDIAFWAEKMQQSLYSFDSESLRPFLPFPSVLQGLWGLVERLFDVRVVERARSQVGPGKAVDTWHDDVLYFDVFDQTNDKEPIAGFFVDAYSRPSEKRGGAWMGECVGRAEVTLPDGSKRLRLPVAYLICNQQPPTSPDRPSLMSFVELTTAFHEFGHVSQHILSSVSDSSVAGIRGVEWDAVELASQFLENFCMEKSVLLSFAKHVDSGEPLPEDLFRGLHASRNYRAASALLRQLHFSALDMALHGGVVDASGKRTLLPALPKAGQEPSPEQLVALQTQIRALEQQLTSEWSLMPFDPRGFFLNSFGHLFAGGYAAGYYSYKWSEVMSADAFQAFIDAAKTGTGDAAEVERQWKALGKKYKDTVLSLGGSVKAAEVFRRFRGRDPSVTPLLQQAELMEETAQQQTKQSASA